MTLFRKLRCKYPKLVIKVSRHPPDFLSKIEELILNWKDVLVLRGIRKLDKLISTLRFDLLSLKITFQKMHFFGSNLKLKPHLMQVGGELPPASPISLFLASKKY